MKKFIKTILLIIVALIVVFIGSYLYLRYMPAKSIDKQPADYTLTATALANEYNMALEKSDKKYIDRIITVSGTISNISTDQNQAPVFILNDGNADAGVLCTIDQASAKKASAYSVGDKVTVKGICTGMLFEVVLNKCIIID